MGDRTYCVLQLRGEIAAARVPMLAQLLCDNFCDDPDPVESFMHHDPKTDGLFTFSFEEVNYGEFPKEIKDWLKESKVSFAWWWDAGGDYDAGVTAYDAISGQLFEWGVLGSAIALTAYQLDNTELVKRTKEWHVWLAGFREIGAFRMVGEIPPRPPVFKPGYMVRKIGTDHIGIVVPFEQYTVRGHSDLQEPKWVAVRSLVDDGVAVAKSEEYEIAY